VLHYLIRAQPDRWFSTSSASHGQGEFLEGDHQRWEFETSLREIETQLLEPGSTLRSKTSEMVRQEIWALLLTHYAV